MPTTFSFVPGPCTMACVLLICVLANQVLDAKKIKCQAEECNLKEEHFKLYSSIKKALDGNFSMKGKDIIPLVRSVEVLKLRFAASSASEKPQHRRQLEGTELISALLASDKLRLAMEVFSSDEGRALVGLYKSSINGNHQSLACSQWRVGEIEYAARKLEHDGKLSEVFQNIHKNFVERSARKCLKSSCSSIDENMNHLSSIQRHSSRRKGFVAREDLTGNLYHDDSNGSLDELVAQVENEPSGEFQREELELCRFFKRTNATNCQASGNELAEISFVKAVQVNNETVLSNLDNFLRDYRQNKESPLATEVPSKPSGETKPDEASLWLLAQCRSLQPLLEYHMFGLRWYQKRNLITSHKMQMRTFWCPSLSYWIEIDRLCNELEMKLAGGTGARDGEPNSDGSFAY